MDHDRLLAAVTAMSYAERYSFLEAIEHLAVTDAISKNSQGSVRAVRACPPGSVEEFQPGDGTRQGE